MRILAINGSPKAGGFSAGALDIAASYLENHGVEVQRIRIADVNIQECTGVFYLFKNRKMLVGG